MSQGSINMPSIRPAQIGAIADALKVAEETFGFGTTGLQQKLLKTQQQAADTDLQMKNMDLGFYKDLYGDNSGGKPQSPLAGAIPTDQPSPQSQPGPQSALAQVPFMDKVNQAAAKGNPRALAIQKSMAESQEAIGKNKLVQNQVSNIPATNLKLQQENDEIGQRIKLAKTEADRKGEDRIFGVAKDFDAASKELRDQLAAFKSIGHAFETGNPADINIAKAYLPLAVMNIKRMGGGDFDSNQLTQKIQDYLSQGKSGLPDDKTLRQFIGASNRSQVNVATQIDDLASRYAQQSYNAGIGADKFGSADALKQAIVNPGAQNLELAKAPQGGEGGSKKQAPTDLKSFAAANGLSESRAKAILEMRKQKQQAAQKNNPSTVKAGM